VADSYSCSLLDRPMGSDGCEEKRVHAHEGLWVVSGSLDGSHRIPSSVPYLKAKVICEKCFRKGNLCLSILRQAL